MVKASGERGDGRRLGAISIIAHESLHEYPTVAADRAGNTAFQGLSSLPPALLLNGIVRPRRKHRRMEPSPEELERRRRWFDWYIDHQARNSVRLPAGGGPYNCPCCGCRTLDERGGSEICP